MHELIFVESSADLFIRQTSDNNVDAYACGEYYVSRHSIQMLEVFFLSAPLSQKHNKTRICLLYILQIN